jgi:hypothetical protein
MQLSKIIIGSLLTVLVMAGLFIYFGSGITTYSSTIGSGFDNSSFVKIANISNKIGQTVNETESELNAGSSGSVLDFVGYFFNKGYQAAKVSIAVVEGEYILVNEALNIGVLGTYGTIIKSILTIAILVVFTIGILLAFIIKSGRE